MVPRVERPPPAPRLISTLSHASKKSFRSHSSSMFQADDERSDTDEDDDMASVDSTLDGEERAGEPKYPGEDTRPTSNKELAGWYAYAFAAEVYVICGEYWCIGRACAGWSD